MLDHITCNTFNWLLMVMVLIFLFFLSLGRIRYVSSIDPDATLSYIREIKDTFVDQERKYEMLVDVRKDFKAGRFGTKIYLWS